MLATLNIVIGLIFVLLLFSLLASTVMEVIAAMLSLRAKHLRNTLENMLGEKMDDFVRHPLFRQISYATNIRRARQSPYYLPGQVSKETFVTIILDILDSGDKDALQAKIQGMEEGEPKRILQFILRQSGGDPAAFKAYAERWFDEVMSRAADWYKRNLKWWLFAVGLVLAAIFNADTIQMYKNISANATLQTFLVDMATNYEAKTDSVTGPNLNLTVDQSIARMDSALQKIEYIRSPLGLGWNEPESDTTLPWWLVKLAGLLLTGIAVTFGAPFWFDLLRKMLALRGGTEKPQEPPPSNPPILPAPMLPNQTKTVVVETEAPAKAEPVPAKAPLAPDKPVTPPSGRGKAVG